MKNLAKIVFFVFAVVQGVAFEINFNSGRDNNAPFATLHLSNEREFTCLLANARGEIIEKPQNADTQNAQAVLNAINSAQESENFAQNVYICEIEGVVDSDLKDQSFDFFDIKFQKNELNTRIFIYPKMPVKRYDLSQRIYDTTSVSGNLNDTNSTNFTFVFSREIPHLKEHDGLNFDIVFPNVTHPFVGALDLDSQPVVIPQSGDINTFLRIKNDFEQENFTQVVTDATNAISRYQGSIFMNEFMLYRLRAQDKLYSNSDDIAHQEILEQMISEAKAWNRNFASDRNYPEVLYLMLRAYIALGQRSNIDYTIQILSSEHEGNYFAQLGMLDYADYILRLGNKNGAKALFNDLYYKSQNVEIATRAALHIARINLNDKDKTRALELINTVLDANRAYFGKDRDLAIDLARLLNDNGEFALSSEIYELVFAALPQNAPNYEEILRNLALTTSKTEDFAKAKKYLDLYREDYENSEHIALIKEAADGVFFNIAENNATFLHQRYKELQEEYANEIAAKALFSDVKLYYDENNTRAVMDYRAQIERFDNNEIKEMLANSALATLKSYLKADDCINSTRLIEDYAAYDLGSRLGEKKQVLGCFIRTMRTEQAREFITAHKGEDMIFYNLEEAQIELNAKNYARALNLANSVINSRLIKSEDEKFRANYYKFLALFRQGDYNGAVKTLGALERFPMNYQMVELYNEFLHYCVDNNLTQSVLSYAPKAIDYQNLRGVNVYTPELEFAYLWALNKSGNDKEALNVLLDLLKVNLSAENRARALYTQSQIYERQGDINSQKQSLNSCILISEISPWRDLCREKIELLNPPEP